MLDYKFCKSSFNDKLKVGIDTYEITENKIKVIHARGSKGKFVFQISIPIIVSDNRGTAHIVEHSIASEINLSGMRSMILAETNIDRTIFTIYSETEQDLLLSIEIVLEEIYNPKFLKNKEIYFREGINYSYDSVNEKWNIGGVVHNEMQWIKSEPIEFIKRLINVELYKGSSYSYQCGGSSDEIVKSTYDDTILFYENNYKNVPLIYFYGNMKFENVIPALDKYFSYKVLVDMKERKEKFQAGNGKYFYLSDKLKKDTIISFSYNIGVITADKYMFLQYLKGLIYANIEEIFPGEQDIDFSILINDTNQYGSLSFFFIAKSNYTGDGLEYFSKLKKYIYEEICNKEVDEEILRESRLKLFNIFEMERPFEVELGEIILNREAYKISFEDYLQLQDKEFSITLFYKFINDEIVNAVCSQIRLMPTDENILENEAEVFLNKTLKNKNITSNFEFTYNNNQAPVMNSINNYGSSTYEFIEVTKYEYRKISVFEHLYKDLDREYINIYLDIEDLTIKEKQMINIFCFIINLFYNGFCSSKSLIKSDISSRIISFTRGNEVFSKLLISVSTYSYKEKNIVDLVEHYFNEIKNIIKNSDLLNKILLDIYEDLIKMDERALYKYLKVYLNRNFSKTGMLEYYLYSDKIYSLIKDIIENELKSDFVHLVEKKLRISEGSIISHHSIQLNKKKLEEFIDTELAYNKDYKQDSAEIESDVEENSAKNLGIIYDTNMFYIGKGIPFYYDDEYEFYVVSLIINYINKNYLYSSLRKAGAYFSDIKAYYSQNSINIYVMRVSDCNASIKILDQVSDFIRNNIVIEDISDYIQELIDSIKNLDDLDYRYSDKFAIDSITEGEESSIDDIIDRIRNTTTGEIDRVKNKIINQMENSNIIIIANEYGINKNRERLDEIIRLDK